MMTHMTNIVLSRLTEAFPSSRFDRVAYVRFELAPRGSIYVPHHIDRAHVSRSGLSHGRYPNNEELKRYCETRCVLYQSGRIDEYHVMPHQIDRLVHILERG